MLPSEESSSLSTQVYSTFKWSILSIQEQNMLRFEISKFSPSPDQELICGICMNVFDAPRETPCRHVFCRDCLQTALYENPRCPACRNPCSPNQTREVVPLVQNLINKLTMKCDNKDQGCTDLVQKEFFLDHLKSCQYGTVPCRYEQCGQILLRKDQEEHETKMCVYRDRMCANGCGLLMPKENLTSHNCIEALLALVKDLNERNSELQKNVSELQSECAQAKSAITAMQLSSAAHSSDDSDSDITRFSVSSYSLSNSDVPEDLNELEYDDECVNLENANTALSRTCERVFAGRSVASHGTDPTHEQTKVDSSCHQSDEPLIRSRVVVTENRIGVQIEGQSVSGAADVTQESSSKDSLNETLAEANSCLQNHGPISTCMIGLSGSVILPQGGSDGQPHCPSKRSEEHIDFNCRKKIKLSPASESCHDAHSKPACSGDSQGIAFSKTEKQKQSKQHKSLSLESCPVIQTAGSDQSCSAAMSENPSREPPQVHSVESSADGDQVNGGHLNQDNQWPVSRRGPMTRSKGCSEHVMLKESVVISNVKVPPSFAYLLDKYAEEDESSDDEVWSPKKG